MHKTHWNIPFNEEMAVPGTSIAGKRNKEQEPPTEENRAQQEENTKECAHKVPTPCGRFRMLVHIECPEIFQAPEIHGFHTLISKSTKLDRRKTKPNWKNS